MKEIIAVIRSNKLSRTKKALEDAGFPSFTCRSVMGTGKKVIDPNIVRFAVEDDGVSNLTPSDVIYSMSRLVPKRLFVMIVPDENVKEVVDIFIEANSEGNPGDGKIFVLPIFESFRVRDGEMQTDTDSY